MYISHFTFTEPPFSITPNPRFLYLSAQHREGLAHLLYGVRQPGGFVQLTGEVGTGKTTICRCLMEQLPPEVDIALILNPRLNVVEFLKTMCDELRIAYPADTASVKVLVDGLYEHLLAAHERGRRTVLIVDEAQNLTVEVLEQVRLLTNLETATEKLLQIILIGQPELIRLLDQPRLRQLAQRITARYHLRAFSRAETCAYICHRLRIAGRADALFTPAAMRRVHRLSGGVPRLVNVICDRALLGAYAHDRRRVDLATVRRAGRQVRGLMPRFWRAGRFAWASGLALLALALAGGAILLTPGQLSVLRGPSTGSPVPAAAQATPAAASRDDDRTGSSDPAWGERTTAAGVGGGGVDGSPRLGDLLEGAAWRRDEALGSLFSRWKVEYGRTGAGDGCEAGRSEGLECLLRSGTWNKLRRFDLPAVLDLATPTGERRPVALVGLAAEIATLVIGGREYTYPLREVDAHWDGHFILLWKPPPVGSRLIVPGMRGKAVAWLRNRLDAVEGRPIAGPHSAVYDEELKRRILAFQRSRSLTPDGLVGEETLALLALAIREPGRPSLSRRAP